MLVHEIQRHHTTDSLTVGSKARSAVRISILPNSDGDGHAGLPVMDFLMNFRYHVDFYRSVIEWGA